MFRDVRLGARRQAVETPAVYDSAQCRRYGTAHARTQYHVIFPSELAMDVSRKEFCGVRFRNHYCIYFGAGSHQQVNGSRLTLFVLVNIGTYNDSSSLPCISCDMAYASTRLCREATFWNS